MTKFFTKVTKVNHKVLFDKLEHYGMRGQPHEILQLYLRYQIQYISAYDNYCSSIIPVTCGVPQGSDLGPFLFLVHINELPTCTDSRIIFYTNDAVLICQEKSKPALKAKPKKELKNVNLWVAGNKLFLNFDKIHCVFYFNKSKPKQRNFVLNINSGNCFYKYQPSSLG